VKDWIALEEGAAGCAMDELGYAIRDRFACFLPGVLPAALVEGLAMGLPGGVGGGESRPE
jgi:hypothetical protein